MPVGRVDSTVGTQQAMAPSMSCACGPWRRTRINIKAKAKHQEYQEWYRQARRHVATAETETNQTNGAEEIEATQNMETIELLHL